MRQPLQESQSSQRKLPWIIVGTGLMLAGLVAFFWLPGVREGILPASTPPVVPAAVHYSAPDVALTDLQGRAVALSDYRGRVIIYNAWATWCPPCRQEMPVLEAYYRMHVDEGLVVVAIENGEPVRDVADFASRYQLTFPIWPDPRWKAAVTFKAVSLPTSFVIDRGGTVRLTWMGAISRAMLDKYVTPLISEAQ